MNCIRIYVEGIADVKFLKDFIEYNFFNSENLGKLNSKDVLFNNAECNFSIKGIEGIGNLEKIINTIRPQYDMGDKIIFILDADYNKNNGGFNVRKKYIEDILQKHSIENSEVFLFPDNHNDGDLEDLLSDLISPNNIDIVDCWNHYETCLLSKNKNYTLPARKTKIYGYLEAILTNQDKKLIKEEYRNYKEEKHWNLNHEKAEPLKDFLKQFFQN